MTLQVSCGDFDDITAAIAVAMGHFKGAKKSKEAKALQFKFIDRLKELVDNDQRQLFLNQLYDIDQRSKNPMEEGRWGTCCEDSEKATVACVTKFLLLVGFPLNISEDYSKSPKQVELLTYKDGKWIAESKEEDYQILNAYLEKERKVCGKAVDNGDCFYDALAQLLDSDVAALRQQVLGQLESDLEKYKLDFESKGETDTWETYLERVGLPCDKLPEGALPCWGDINFEGKILAEIHEVQITCHQVLEKKNRVAVGVDVVPTSPIGPKESKLIELANVGRHFMPVFPKLED